MKDDAQLIDETLAGNTGSFGQLVLKYQDRLYNTVVHVVGCREEAQDVVQDAFVQAFVKLGSFRRTSAFYTWLYRIAFNASISRRRRRRPTSSIEQIRETIGHQPTDDDWGPHERLERQEQAHRVRRALGALTEQHRAILVLREVDGFCYESIADVLDLPIGTVRSRLHRARLQLRGRLEEVLQQYQ